RQAGLTRFARSLLPGVGRGVLIGVISVLVINMGYGFEGSFRSMRDFRFVSETFKTMQGGEDNRDNLFLASWLREVPIPLPADMIQGIDLQRVDFERDPRKSYLNGEIRQGGWWYYYLYGFLYKVPLGTIALVLGAAYLTFVRRPLTPNRSPGEQQGEGLRQ